MQGDREVGRDKPGEIGSSQVVKGLASCWDGLDISLVTEELQAGKNSV